MRRAGGIYTKERIERAVEEFRAAVQARHPADTPIERGHIESLFNVKRRMAWEILVWCGFTKTGIGKKTVWRFPAGCITYHKPAKNGQGGEPHVDQGSV